MGTLCDPSRTLFSPERFLFLAFCQKKLEWISEEDIKNCYK